MGQCDTRSPRRRGDEDDDQQAALASDAPSESTAPHKHANRGKREKRERRDLRKAERLSTERVQRELAEQVELHELRFELALNRSVVAKQFNERTALRSAWHQWLACTCSNLY